MKINTSKWYIIISAIIFCIILAFLIRYLFVKREIRAFVSSSEIYQDEIITFMDSTFNAKTWLWEFGNGDESSWSKGEYKYETTGQYRIRLKVDNSLQKEFYINVRPKIKMDVDSLIRIIAPPSAFQNAQVLFRGTGSSKQWKWSFGETGMTDAFEDIAFYTYTLPGIYEVTLTTEDTQYAITHTIEIFPESIEEIEDREREIGNDIREKLQAIVDGEPFNPNYNHIMRNYLCNNSDVLVTVNNEKRNDFFSYCRGLEIIGKKITTIVRVDVEVNDANPDCLQKLLVTQYTQ
ncbi:MAG: PKD domain-containing protein [Candidatus Symbiothrix sp.]|jgi:hypothetical protein|nr:PKD domain-containing protein [Candidatus Symbiothrix sp.]